MRWSRIHAQLGEVSGELTYQLLASAVTEQMPEAEDLDWKATLPGKDDTQLDEFAKDVAAMANTAGGLIAYGVAEDRGTGRAKSMQNVDISEGSRRRLRALAANRIHPPVLGLDLVPLTSDDGQTSLLALSIPRSPDAPHLIGRGNRLGVPYRSGPETHWMQEGDLERAYANRFSRRADEHARLAEMVEEMVEQLEPDRAWIVAAVHPRAPRPAISTVPTRGDIAVVLEQALNRSNELLPPSAFDRYMLLRELDQAALNPRVGLRRWIPQTLPSASPDDRCHFVHVQLHHDGAVGFAVALEGWYDPLFPNRHHVPHTLIESFAADLVTLSNTYGRHLGAQLPSALRAELIRPDSSRPFVLIGRERHGAFAAEAVGQIRGTRTVRKVTPILTEIPAPAGPDDLMKTARSITEDILHQFGMASLPLLTGRG
ncbi:helix-turn-helix domain-containing protein [Micromonospora sp. C51]|uniref:AlbA family DNA-binding domain-containing protein n=1 Tax=Micromonospora sp. C51 TaxID=2824879 RepID=UPI001FFD04BF|nr:ATP-binding protein [Micromonospora sp. C51]